MKALFPLVVAAFLTALVSVNAQQAPMNTEFKIASIVPAFQTTPTYSGVQFDKRGGKSGPWLEVEVTFDWTPRLKDPLYTDATVNFYILLATPPTKDNPKGNTLLTGTTNLQNIAQMKGMHTAVYVSPKTLERLFNGKSPTNPTSAVKDVGVTITAGSGIVAEQSWKGRGEWWAAVHLCQRFCAEQVRDSLCAACLGLL